MRAQILKYNGKPVVDTSGKPICPKEILDVGGEPFRPEDRTSSWPAIKFGGILFIKQCDPHRRCLHPEYCDVEHCVNIDYAMRGGTMCFYHQSIYYDREDGSPDVPWWIKEYIDPTFDFGLVRFHRKLADHLDEILKMSGKRKVAVYG